VWNVACLFQWSIAIFHHKLQIYAFVTFWHEFKNSVAFSNWAVLRSQQFTNGHFHHLSLWNRCPPSNVASVFPNHFLHSCFVHICPWCAEVAGAMMMMMMMIISSLMPILKPCSFFWHSALLCLYQYGIAILWGSILHLSRSHHTTKLFAGPSFKCSWYCTSCYLWISSYWLMWWQLLCVTLQALLSTEK
jgi:hypothetical protein